MTSPVQIVVTPGAENIKAIVRKEYLIAGQWTQAYEASIVDSPTNTFAGTIDPVTRLVVEEYDSTFEAPL